MHTDEHSIQGIICHQNNLGQGDHIFKTLKQESLLYEHTSGALFSK